MDSVSDDDTRTNVVDEDFINNLQEKGDVDSTIRILDESTQPLLSVSSSSSSATAGQRHNFGQKINILRSPSRESVGTDISLFSVSTLASELTNRVKLLSLRMPGDNTASLSRGPSPNFESRRFRRPENIQEVWFEEPNNMIKGIAALSSAVGLTKSFSTSDIVNLPGNYGNCDGAGVGSGEYDTLINGTSTNNLFFRSVKRNAVSEMAINSLQNCSFLLDQSVRLDNVSRSCSTWVAIGDIPSTSQLPSPHGGNLPTNKPSSKSSCTPSFSPADLIRSVNKKVRQHYIRQRLLNTYKALERLSQSEFNLDKLEVEAAACAKTCRGNGGGIADSSGQYGPSSRIESNTGTRRASSNRLSVPGAGSCLIKQQWKNSLSSKVSATEESLTIIDVDRERGQPLSKYDRNMMIFNWLLTLESDENVTES